MNIPRPFWQAVTLLIRLLQLSLSSLFFTINICILTSSIASLPVSPTRLSSLSPPPPLPSSLPLSHTYAMQIIDGIKREIEIDNIIDHRSIKAPRSNIRAHKVRIGCLPEMLPILLSHLIQSINRCSINRCSINRPWEELRRAKWWHRIPTLSVCTLLSERCPLCCRRQVYALLCSPKLVFLISL